MQLKQMTNFVKSSSSSSSSPRPQEQARESAQWWSWWRTRRGRALEGLESWFPFPNTRSTVQAWRSMIWNRCDGFCSSHNMCNDSFDLWQSFNLRSESFTICLFCFHITLIGINLKNGQWLKWFFLHDFIFPSRWVTTSTNQGTGLWMCKSWREV